MKKNNLISFFVNFLFLLIYIFPIRFFKDLTGYDVDKYIFLGICLLLYLVIILKNKKIDMKEIVFISLIVLISVFKKSIEPLMLFEYLLLYKVLKNHSNEITISNKILWISLFGTIFYSIIYFGKLKGYLSTGLMEINQTGFLIFFLFLLFYKKNKKIGKWLLIFGLLTLSRNYLLCLIIFFLCNNKIGEKLYNILSFKKLLIISLLFLTALSYSFNWAYDNGKISESYNDFRKYIYIYDYSNYFRFSTNFSLIELYFDEPYRLLTGIEKDDFINLNLIKAREKNRLYRPILPHNYFFSYFRIYGVFCIFIFMFLEKIIDLVKSKDNFVLLLVLFVYANILGVGFTNYYLFLTMFTMLSYKEGGE